MPETGAVSNADLVGTIDRSAVEMNTSTVTEVYEDGFLAQAPHLEVHSDEVLDGEL